ncbi:hypothetical protein JXB12_10660 [candidate division KSB1 bacterium]|nr:hypothetical protein [candidate division KSB1 bacterium]
MIGMIHPQTQRAQIITKYGPVSSYERQYRISIDSVLSEINLIDSLIIKNSELIVWSDDTLKRSQDYEIDYIRGKLKLADRLTIGSQLNISYRYLPFHLRTTYTRRRMTYLGDSTRASIPIESITTANTYDQTTLRKNGSVVRGISIGSNQGLKVESGLRMNLSGRIADKVDVVAALTDQNTPIQPEGNTQTLNEIDKVYIQLKSDHFDATMGDYYLAFDGSEFSSYQRKLQGAMGSMHYDDLDVTLSGAVSKGKYTSNKFNGQEGNQGPYQLRGDNGQIDIIVLAGTEKVWIDGELMVRGENNDYVIEYSNGQITFTRRRLITSDSRITIDFQYSDLQFQRSLFGLNAKSRLWDDRLNIDLRLLHEADDKNNPLDFTLTDENLSQLQQAGDEIDSAYVSGVKYVGEGKGRYVQVDSLNIRFYRYVGDEMGDYSVSFHYVGPEKGDYKSLGYGRYSYVGEKRGTYLPIIALKPAQRHDLADMSTDIKLTKNLVLSTELAMSKFDYNAYSDIGDGDNVGIASNTSLEYAAEKMSLQGINLGSLKISGKLRKVGQDFQYIDRTDVVEKTRKWDSEGINTNEESIRELSVLYSPVANTQLSVGHGDISKGSTFRSHRVDAKMTIALDHLPQLRYELERIGSENDAASKQGDWFRNRGGFSYQWWKVRPFMDYLAEDKKETIADSARTGFRFHEYTYGLDLVNLKNFATTVSFIKRDDAEYRDKIRKPTSNSFTQRYQWQYKKGNQFAVNFQFIHRERRFNDLQQNDTKTDLGDLELMFSAFRRAIKTNWHYQISNTQVAKKERVYFKVEQGEGNYRFNEETDEYEPDDLGDFILRIRDTDDFIPVIELKANSRVRFEPGLMLNRQKKSLWYTMLSKITTDTHVRIEEKTEEDDVWAIYRLDLDKFQRTGTTLFGNRNVRHDTYLFENERDFSIRFRYEEKKEVNYQYIEEGVRNTFIERSLRIMRRFSDKFSLQLDAQNASRSYHFTARSDKYIRLNELLWELSYRPKQIIEISLKSKLALKKDQALDPATEANEFSLMPNCSYSFRGKGKIHAELEWTQVNITPDDRVVPYELVGINRKGTTLRWLIGINYNLSTYLRATVSYNGRSEPDRPDMIHIGRAEIRAYF